MELEDLKGVIVPLLTPVDEDENIDEKRLRKVVEHVITHGIHGILAFGSNSEFYMFDEDEQIEGMKIIIDQAKGRVPLYFGIGAIRTKHAIRLAKKAAQLNIDGISILQPMFVRPTEEALYDHFKAIADAVPDKFVLLYNNPGKTGYAISLNNVEKLAHNVENIVGIKDSSGDLTYTSEVIRRNSDIGFRVFTGKDTITYPGLCIGAVGAVMSTGNMFTELVTGIYNNYVAGDYEKALELQFKLNPVRMSQDAASFPAATKDMANLLGMDVGKSVLPTPESKGKVLENMKQAMKDADLL